VCQCALHLLGRAKGIDATPDVPQTREQIITRCDANLLSFHAGIRSETVVAGRRGDGDQHSVDDVDETVLTCDVGGRYRAPDDLWKGCEDSALAQRKARGGGSGNLRRTGVQALLSDLLAADAYDALAARLGVDGELDALAVQSGDWIGI
jgi:hypothetical protein